MSEHECTEHLYDEIERLRESNFQLRQGAEEQKQRIKRLEDRIHRAAMAFFRDGSDGQVASQMLQILEEERGKP
jgi:predicted RNase H-like nuclease (RuvC/YqgF family)